MGFSEDDRIRRKNAVVNISIIGDRVNLTLDRVPVSDVVKVLTNSGFIVKLGCDQTITISKDMSCAYDNRSFSDTKSNNVNVSNKSTKANT